VIWSVVFKVEGFCAVGEGAGVDVDGGGGCGGSAVGRVEVGRRRRLVGGGGGGGGGGGADRGSGALFEPFRVLGTITEAVPFDVQRLGRETFALLSVGRCWQVYDCKKLTLVLAGPLFPGPIRALAQKGETSFSAVGKTVIVCRRAHEVARLEGHSAPIVSLLRIGDKLLSLGSDAKLLVWGIGAGDLDGDDDEPEVSVALDEGVGASGFAPTCVAHPPTYINKVVIGGGDGRLQLRNFVTGRLVYTFAGFGSAVRSVAPAPALDVLAVGLASGTVVLHNMKQDVTVARFSHEAFQGGVTALSFRTGGGLPMLSVGAASGAVSVWDLERQQLHAVLAEAHDARVVAAHFFTGEPLLMTAGADNAIKQWIFDNDEGAPRLLRFRSGHSAPPSVIAFYGKEGKKILSAGQDRAFRLFSTIQDQQSFELSQRHTKRRAKRMKVSEEEIKLPRVTALAASEVREKDWCNVVTAHDGDASAYTWRLSHGALGEHRLSPPPAQGEVYAAPVSTVGVSSCGNFAVVGTSSGAIHRYNLQSGIHRGAYLDGSGGVGEGLAHAGSVAGVGVDSCNRTLVSAGFDGRVRVWDFVKRSLKCEANAGTPIRLMRFQPRTLMAAVAGDDLAVRVFDTVAGALVRTFRGHEDRIASLAFSDDARWLVTASFDGAVRVFDLPSATLLQAMSLGSPVTALALSPHSEFLVTAHVGKKGLFLWANRLLFTGASEADLAPASAGVVRVTPPNLPLAGLAEDDDEDEEELEREAAERAEEAARAASAAAAEAAADAAAEAALPPLVQIAPQMVTLALLPQAQWQALLHLEAIRERNKPEKAPEKPKAAPFFLPAVASLERKPLWDVDAEDKDAPEQDEDEDEDEDEEEGEKETRTRVRKGTNSSLSKLRRAFSACARTGETASLLAELRSAGASALDAELRLIGLSAPDAARLSPADLEELAGVMRALEHCARTGRAYELVQGTLHRFLQVQGEAVAAHEALRERARALRDAVKLSWHSLDALLQEVRCVTSYACHSL